MCGVFLQCYGVSNDETRNRCCELLNDRLIDECNSDEAVALAYLWFYEQLQKPTLVIAHNKTLAAQLYGEFKEMFPDNAVEYFVS